MSQSLVTADPKEHRMGDIKRACQKSMCRHMESEGACAGVHVCTEASAGTCV